MEMSIETPVKEMQTAFGTEMTENCECSQDHPYEVTVWWSGAHHICFKCREAGCYRMKHCQLKNGGN